MVTAVLRESGCERGGRAAILVQYESIFIEFADSASSTFTSNASKGPNNEDLLPNKWPEIMNELGQVQMYVVIETQRRSQLHTHIVWHSPYLAAIWQW